MQLPSSEIPGYLLIGHIIRHKSMLMFFCDKYVLYCDMSWQDGCCDTTLSHHPARRSCHTFKYHIICSLAWLSLLIFMPFVSVETSTLTVGVNYKSIVLFNANGYMALICQETDFHKKHISDKVPLWQSKLFIKGLIQH